MIKFQNTNKVVKTLLLSSVLATAINSPYAQAEGQSADERFIYAGLELGISEPIWKEFDYIDDDKRTTNIRLSRSKMIGGRIGYGFYPNMMIEISGTHQPQYDLKYNLPEVDLSDKIPMPLGAPTPKIPKTPGQTKIKSEVYTLNLIYKLDSMEFAGIKPYIIGGAGIARIKISESFSTWKSDPLPLGNVKYFRVNKHKMNIPVYQAGLGLSKSFGDNIEVDFSGKFQVFQDIKIKYDTLDLTDLSNIKFKPEKPIKKSIAVGEIALGIIYKLPM